MSLIDLVHKLERTAVKNAPAILTALGVSGTVTTAYLAGKASYEARGVLDFEIVKNHDDNHEPWDRLTRKDKFRLTWRLYIPSAVSGALTIACIITASRVQSKRTAAAYSLLSVSEAAFLEYKDKVVEQIGPKKEQAVRDAIAQDRVNASNVPAVVVGTGDVLCYEQNTGRYFHCDIERLKRAVNVVNAKAIRENEASLDDFYYLIGLEPTSYSSRSGWTSDRLLELEFSAVLSRDGSKPCIAFEYNYLKPI